MKKQISSAPMRIQRMMLKLQPYQFELKYVQGSKIGLADCLSRMSRCEAAVGQSVMDDELMICSVDTLANSKHNRIAQATGEDAELQAVIEQIKKGWPETRSEIPVNTMPYWDCRDELSSYGGIVFRGERIVVPKSMRSEMLKTIHSSHQGMVRSKQRARDLVYWPGMSKQIVDVVSKCAICLENQDKQPKEPMMMHEVPSRPWEKVSCDLCEYKDEHFLVVCDYYSGFIEMAKLEETTSAVVIKHLKANIARYGIMDKLVTDCGSNLVGREFREFAEKYGIELVTSSPYHHQSNGLAENAVKSVKRLLKKTEADGGDIYLGLLDIRNTPRDGLIGSPAQRLMGRRTKTQLPTTEALLKPKVPKPEDVKDQLERYRYKQKQYYD
jgi:hypothetical protein